MRGGGRGRVVFADDLTGERVPLAVVAVVPGITLCDDHRAGHGERHEDHEGGDGGPMSMEVLHDYDLCS